jgi:hypothetical protein
MNKMGRKLSKQSGVIIVIFMLTIPTMLGLMALAIDSGNLYLAKLRLTKVARVASATALNMMALRGWGPMLSDPTPPSSGQPNLGMKTANVSYSPPPVTLANQAVLKEMRQSAIDSLKAYYPTDFASIDPDNLNLPSHLQYRDPEGNLQTYLPITSLNLIDSSVSATFRYAARTYLLGAVSQILGATGPCTKSQSDDSPRCWVESASPPDRKSGKMKPANVFVLLDVSGSMNEKMSDNTKTKKLALDEAAANFIDMFNPLNDKFAFIPYATTADTGTIPSLGALSTSTSSGVPDYLSIKRTIQNYEVGGQTNPCDALLQVAKTIQASPTLQDKNTPKFVLLFTDGAPNVYRLNFCSGVSCAQTPALINNALGSSGAESINPGWYGWTVKWRQREVFQIGAVDVRCPSDDVAVGGNPNSIPACDPVWALPRVVSENNGAELSYSQISNYLKLNEDGEFYFKGGQLNGSTLSQLGYSLKFREFSELQLKDYQMADAYRWNGPSYLVHSSFSIPRGMSLIDRLPPILDSRIGEPVTCGPGSRYPYPGSFTKNSPIVADKYNHSLYFASRAIDADWRWNGTTGNESEGKATKVGLTVEQLKSSPLYFENSQTLHGNPADSPGCLTELSAKIPFSGAAYMHVGDNFASNPANSITTRGEAVKTAELPYYCALRAADWLRSQYNVVLFVVGLGPSASTIYDRNSSNKCEDPLQNALDPNSRKDRFLRRLALAPESLDNPADFFSGKSTVSWSTESDFRFRRNVSLSNCVNHPLAGLSVELGYSETTVDSLGSGPYGHIPVDHKFNNNHLGGYYGADDPEQLKMIFGEIAKRMLLRLSS